MVLYMVVSKPPYELPEVVCGSLQELAETVGMNPNHIASLMSRARKSGSFCRYIRIEVDDDDATVKLAYQRKEG